jgi:hypothetical protein
MLEEDRRYRLQDCHEQSGQWEVGENDEGFLSISTDR